MNDKTYSFGGAGIFLGESTFVSAIPGSTPLPLVPAPWFSFGEPPHPAVHHSVCYALQSKGQAGVLFSRTLDLEQQDSRAKPKLGWFVPAAQWNGPSSPAKEPLEVPWLFSFLEKSFQSSLALLTLVKLSVILMVLCRQARNSSRQPRWPCSCPFPLGTLLFLALLGHTVLQQKDVGDTETAGKCHTGGQTVQGNSLLSGEQPAKETSCYGWLLGKTKAWDQVQPQGDPLNMRLSGRNQSQKFTSIQFQLHIWHSEK